MKLQQRVWLDQHRNEEARTCEEKRFRSRSRLQVFVSPNKTKLASEYKVWIFFPFIKKKVLIFSFFFLRKKTQSPRKFSTTVTGERDSIIKLKSEVVFFNLVFLLLLTFCFWASFLPFYLVGRVKMFYSEIECKVDPFDLSFSFFRQC